MASFAAAACRASVRLARHQLHRDAALRGFRTSAATRAAQNFTMPALSPTMTEGNIAKWQVKEGEKFSAGDVLLEIETDKATMDVEAQEDGILMKIVQGDGTKAIQVGSRIAVIAEEGDDINSLEIPADDGPQPKSAAESAKTEPPVASEPQPAPPTSTPPTPPTSTSKPAGKIPKQTYPLLPSVAHLLKENGLDSSIVDGITPTGPHGRILKGDVLAFLGRINAQTPADNSALFEHASHLDLSNIKVAKAPEAKKPEKAAAPIPEPPKISVVAVSVAVGAVSEVQRTFQKNLNLELDFSSFVLRAAELANEQLPRAKATPDRLFNEVLGLQNEADYFSRGAYLPDVGTARLVSAAPSPSKAPARKLDIIDVISGSSKTKAAKPKVPAEVYSSGAAATFSLVVPSEEAERATVFLQRVKVLLEHEPEKLVL